MDKLVRLFPECYIKLSDISDVSNLSLSTTLNVIICRMFKNKKTYKFNPDKKYCDFIKKLHSDCRENHNFCNFHWYLTKEASTIFYRIKNLDPIKSEFSSDELVLNYLIRGFKGKKIKTIEKLSTKNKRLINIKARFAKYNYEKAKLNRDIFED